MKERALVFALALLCACSLLAVPVFAADNYVYDAAEVLTMEQWQSLEASAAQISLDYDCGVYIVVVEDYEDYGNSIGGASDNIYRDNGFGLYDDASGIMLLLSMSDRKYNIHAEGFGTYALGSTGRGALTDAMLGSLQNNEWYDAFDAYLNGCASILKQGLADYEAGVTRETGPKLMACIIAGLIAGLIVALIVCLILWAKMKSVKKASAAQFYAVPNSLDIYESSDTFSHITETRVKIESDSNRSGGGRPSGGSSNGGGSF